MTKQKKIFLAVGAVFIGLLLFASYDISRRTTFPGSKPQLQERLKEKFEEKDSVLSDTVGKY